MFVQDHHLDFQVVLDAPHDDSVKPFALVRFGDGEIALVDGARYKSADAWSTTGPTWMRGEIIESLRIDLDGFCIGLPTACCTPHGVRIWPAVRAPTSRLTFSSLFLNANLHRARELLDHYQDAVLVGSSGACEIKTPADGVSRPWDVDAVIEVLLKMERPILLAVGPCSNVIALRYWKRQDPSKRVHVLDVGSALDYAMTGISTRPCHDEKTDHVCTWSKSRTQREVLRRAHEESAEVYRYRSSPKSGAGKIVGSYATIGKMGAPENPEPPKTIRWVKR